MSCLTLKHSRTISLISEDGAYAIDLPSSPHLIDRTDRNLGCAMLLCGCRICRRGVLIWDFARSEGTVELGVELGVLAKCRGDIESSISINPKSALLSDLAISKDVRLDRPCKLIPLQYPCGIIRHGQALSVCGTASGSIPVTTTST